VIYALIIPWMAAVNALRGGRCSWANSLPWHTRLTATVLVIGALLLVAPWKVALYLSACWLLWATLPWGEWYDLGHNGGNVWRDRALFFGRNLLALAPTVLVNPLFLLVAVAQSAAYEIGWLFWRVNAIRMAEYITGLAWGIAFFLLV
jgi:hypothetical protein